MEPISFTIGIVAGIIGDRIVPGLSRKLQSFVIKRLLAAKEAQELTTPIAKKKKAGAAA